MDVIVIAIRAERLQIQTKTILVQPIFTFEKCKEMSLGTLNKMAFQQFIEIRIYSQPQRMLPWKIVSQDFEISCAGAPWIWSSALVYFYCLIWLGRKTWKKRKCLLPAFSHFSKMFLQAGQKICIYFSVSKIEFFSNITRFFFFFFFNPFPNKPRFLRVYSTSLLKTLCFLPLSRIFCHICEIWNCHLQTLSVWKSLNFVVWERVKSLSHKHVVFSPYCFSIGFSLKIMKWGNNL